MKTRFANDTPKPFENLRYCLYQGNSMFPLFQESDLLEIVPVSEATLCPSDIIAFYPSAKQQLVVHRVVEKHPEGVLTRGDNNPAPDGSLTAYDSIAGKVCARYRSGKRKTLHHGRVTLPHTAVHRYLRRFEGKGMLFTFLRRLYHLCSRKTVAASLLPSSLTPRIVMFQSHAMPSFRLLLGNRVIGDYHVHRKQWSIRRPFRLLVNERDLPRIL